MLRVKVELVPYGIEKDKSVIMEGTIINRGEVDDYIKRALSPNLRKYAFDFRVTEEGGEEWEEKGEIEHQRGDGLSILLMRVLNQVSNGTKV